ncbi:MAG: tRNA pseudouridine(65) synthase TruC [Aestuariibacter sp.]
MTKIVADYEQSLRVLYQDDELVAVFKPSGLLVHRSMIDRHETQFAMQQTRDLIGQHVFPVHRLDKPTSGVLLFALNAEMAKLIGERFSQHQVVKEYVALVRGHCNEQHVVDYPLKEKLDKIADKKANSDKPAQSALTEVLPLTQYELQQPVGRYSTARYSLVKLLPKTGRKHQLRRHLSHLRHPILGDVNYGDNKHNRFMRDTFHLTGLALCAKVLRFNHPRTEQAISIHSAVDHRFGRTLSAWGESEQRIQSLWSQ